MNRARAGAPRARVALSALFLLLSPLFAGSRPVTAEALPGEAAGIVVFQSDFGLADGAVAAMHGVARQVAPRLVLEDLTHEIPPYDIWQAAYRLDAGADFWPKGTVFVSVVDPGVGTDRRSVVLLTRSGHFFVSPDNGTLTLVADRLGVAALREIDETANRRPGSRHSHTFHGRDIYAFTAARLAAGKIDFQGVGRLLAPEVNRLAYEPARLVDDIARGTIPALDIRYGNVWTDIGRPLFESLGIERGDPVSVRITEGERMVYEGRMPYAATFGAVAEGTPLLYVNSADNMALALNQGSFAGQFGIGSGPAWRIALWPAGRQPAGGLEE